MSIIPDKPPTYTPSLWLVVTQADSGRRMAINHDCIERVAEGTRESKDAAGATVLGTDGSETRVSESLDELLGLPVRVTEPEAEE